MAIRRILLSLLMLSMFGTAWAASSSVQVMVNGRAAGSGQVIGGRVMVDLASILRALDPQSTVATQAGAASARVAGSNLAMQNGSSAVFLNGGRYTVDAPIAVRGGRVLVPISFIRTVLGANVAWNGLAGIVSVTARPMASTGTVGLAPTQDGVVTALPGDAQAVSTTTVQGGSPSAAIAPTLSAGTPAPAIAPAFTLGAPAPAIAPTVTMLEAPAAMTSSPALSTTVTGGQPSSVTSPSMSSGPTVSFSQPRANDTVGSSFDIVGSTSPNAIVVLDVRRSVPGTITSEQRARVQVRAGRDGSFHYRFVERDPRAKSTFSVTAEARDSEGRASMPTTIAVGSE